MTATLTESPRSTHLAGAGRALVPARHPTSRRHPACPAIGACAAAAAVVAEAR